jgi:hypothetical protein
MIRSSMRAHALRCSVAVVLQVSSDTSAGTARSRLATAPSSAALAWVPCCSVAVTLLLLLAGSARAIEASLRAPYPRDGWVWADVKLDDPIAPRVAESLTRGMPATLQLHAELWRHRSGWFDRLESSYDAAVRIRYEVWNDQFRLERAGMKPVFVPSLDSLRAVLSRPLAVPVARLEKLQVPHRYYVVATATLKPLSVEDAEEVEGWLSGEVEDKARARLGIVTALPRAVFDAVRNFAGFGDQKARAISPDFEAHDVR